MARKSVINQQVTNTAAQLHAAPANTPQTISFALATNVSGSSETLTLWIVPDGDSRGDANKYLDAVAIGDGDARKLVEIVPATLSGGDSIHAQASANSAINLLVSVGT